MKGTRNIGLLVIVGLLLIFGVWGCSGYKSLVNKDEAVNLAWGNVNVEYENRAALVDNLVSTVKGAAKFEQETLTGIVEARAKATSINFKAEDATPENVAKLQQAQGQLSGALSRLLVVSENYPDLKASQNFLQLQSQLEGIENSIRNSRRQFNEAVAAYNVKQRAFPVNILAGLFGFERKKGFEAEAGSEKAPKVKFD